MPPVLLAHGPSSPLAPVLGRRLALTAHPRRTQLGQVAPRLQSGACPHPRLSRLRARVFRRTLDPAPPVAVDGHGSTILDAAGREYLDAAGGAIVVNVGHGRRVDRRRDRRAGRRASPTPTARRSPPSRSRPTPARSGRVLPVDDPAIYPVSGGSEAIETALKLARAYHLARGEADRWIVIARWGSYHGNTLGALDLSGRRPLRRPYEGWLGRFRHVSAAYPYRAGEPDSHALGDADELAAELERAIEAAGPGHGGRVRRRADRRGDARRGRAAGRLLAADRRGLPPPRRPAHRRRGHDRASGEPAAGSASITGASAPTSSSPPRARRRATGRSGSSPRPARSTTP